MAERPRRHIRRALGAVAPVAHGHGLAHLEARHGKAHLVLIAHRHAVDFDDHIANPQPRRLGGGLEHERLDAHPVAHVLDAHAQRGVVAVDRVVDGAALHHPRAPALLHGGERLAERPLDRVRSVAIVGGGAAQLAVELLELPFSRQELEHGAHLRIEPLRILHEGVAGESHEILPALPRLRGHLPPRDVEADIRVELDGTVGAQRVVLVQAREALLHPDGVPLSGALHVGEVQQVHELVLQALSGIARNQPPRTVQVHAADLGALEVVLGVGRPHDGDQHRILWRLAEVCPEEVRGELVERALHARVRRLVEEGRVHDGAVIARVVAVPRLVAELLGMVALPLRHGVGCAAAARTPAIGTLARRTLTLEPLARLHDRLVGARGAHGLEVLVGLHGVEVAEAGLDALHQPLLGARKPTELGQHAGRVVEQDRVAVACGDACLDEAVGLLEAP